MCLIRSVKGTYITAFKAKISIPLIIKIFLSLNWCCVIWGRRGRDRMVLGFTTTYAISAYHY
jgi:hypothetical protein